MLKVQALLAAASDIDHVQSDRPLDLYGVASAGMDCAVHHADEHAMVNGERLGPLRRSMTRTFRRSDRAA